MSPSHSMGARSGLTHSGGRLGVTETCSAIASRSTPGSPVPRGNFDPPGGTYGLFRTCTLCTHSPRLPGGRSRTLGKIFLGALRGLRPLRLCVGLRAPRNAPAACDAERFFAPTYDGVADP